MLGDPTMPYVMVYRTIKLNMAAPTNYAVLFSGGSNKYSNFSRYYNSTKSTYEALIDRGVKAENITIFFANGVDGEDTADQMNGDYLSGVYDTKIQTDHLFEGNDVYSGKKVTDQQWSSFFDQYGVYDLGIQDKLRKLMESAESTTLPNNESNLDAAKDYVGMEIAIKQYLEEKNSPLDIKYNAKFSEDNSEIITNLSLYRKSDFSFANGSNVFPGTESALKSAVDGGDYSLSEKITANDSLFVWTFDHGNAKNAEVDPKSPVYGLIPEEFKGNTADLTGWGDNEKIYSQEFADIFENAISKARTSTFALAQCYSGGLLQAMKDDKGLLKSSNWFGMAAANQYQVSLGSFFADQVAKGLRENKRTGKDLFDSVINSKYEVLAPQGYEPNSYPKEYWEERVSGERSSKKNNLIEHPWSYQSGSAELPMFVDVVDRDGVDSQGVQLLSQESLVDSQFTFSFALSVSEDQILDLFASIKPLLGDLSDLSFEGYAPSAFGIIDYKEKNDSLTYTPISNFNGQDSVVLRFDDGDISFDAKLDIDVESVNDAPMAVDDLVQISSSDIDVLINVIDEPGFLDDTDADGDTLSITSYSAPDNGTIEKVGDFLFEYQPNAGFVGSDSFLYVLSDGEAFDVAEVLINVVDSSL
jgi:hypothetical protein